MNEQNRYRHLREALKKEGWVIKKRGSHYIAYPIDGVSSPIPIPCSPGRGRASQNMAAQLKRAGFTKRW